jgi:recombination endonuclease VII
MLCRMCNTALGLLEDNIERLKWLMRYLENAEIIAQSQ